jgi:hypothetical protein
MTEQDQARLDALANLSREEWTVDDYRIVVQAFREAPPSVQDDAMAILRGEREVRT